MEEYTQITLDMWMQWKEDIRKKLEETAGNFVHIGYRLKQIRDSGMYGGAADIFEFAEKEYGLGKSTVSRFIAINEKYSEGGDSLELKEEFRGFSSSKLSEMLTLPDSEIQLITEKTTVREIRELKNFNSQRPEETEADEGHLSGQECKNRPALEKCLIDFFKTRKETLNGVMKCLDTDPAEYKRAAELMAPSGQASHRKGIVFLFMYDWATGIKYKLMTEPEPVSMSWQGLLDIVYGIFENCREEDAVATSQQEKRPDSEQKMEPETVLPEEPEDAVPEDTVATSQQEQELEGGQEPETENKPAETPKDEGIPDTDTDGLGEEIAPEQFSAESLNEDSILEPEKTTEIPPETVQETTEVIEPDPDPSDQPERMQEKTQEEPAGQQDIVKTYTRKQYLDQLSEAEAADYISKEYKRHTIYAIWLNSSSKLKKWLERKVDEAGNEV